jgi:hypothetical protein
MNEYLTTAIAIFQEPVYLYELVIALTVCGVADKTLTYLRNRKAKKTEVE